MYGQQPGVQYASGMVQLSVPGSGSLLPTTFEAVGRSTAGFDETVQFTMSLTAQLDTASTDVSVTRHFALLEVLGG